MSNCYLLTKCLTIYCLLQLSKCQFQYDNHTFFNGDSFHFNKCNYNSISNPCNNGICIMNESHPDGYSCYCYNGFTGIKCSKNFDECKHHNPCLNGATCINDAPNARCLCVSGFCGM